MAETHIRYHMVHKIHGNFLSLITHLMLNELICNVHT